MCRTTSMRTIWAAVLLVVCSAASLSAELILDDFDDAASTTSPAMVNTYVDTTNVGDFNATRSIRIFGGQADPVGRIDVDQAGSSAYVASLGELNPRSGQTPIVSVQSRYVFSVADATEGGRNDSILFDFRRLTAAFAPIYLRIIVFDSTTSYESVIAPVPRSSSPFTLAMPFESFGIRGSGGGAADFTQISSARVTLTLVQGGGPASLDFDMELDRIRFGRIPEPGSCVLAITALGFLVGARSMGQLFKENRNDKLVSLSAGFNRIRHLKRVRS